MGVPDHLTCLLRNLYSCQKATVRTRHGTMDSKLGKEYVKAVYCHSAYLTYMQSQFSSFQSLSRVQLFVTPWTAACQASLSITNSQSLLKLMSIELVMPSKHLILCHSLLLPPSIFPSIRVFSKEPTHWKRPWCWERLRAGGEGEDRGWDVWVILQTQWMWIWASSRSWWWTRKAGMPQSMGLQSRTQLSDWTELN